MPHLLIRGVQPQQVQEISVALVDELSLLCQCPPDHLLLECMHTTAIFGGEVVASYPFVVVEWFDRGEQVRDAVAACIDRHFRSLGIAELEVAFREFEQACYYAGGVSLRVNENEELRVENERLRQELHSERERLKEEQERFRLELRKARASASGAHMSSKLRDALRE